MDNKKTTKEIYRLVDKIDISANEKDVEYHKNRWEGIPIIRSWNNTQNHVLQSSEHINDANNTKESALKEYLKKHPERLSTGVFKENIGEYSWIQNARFSTDLEKKLLKQTYEIYEGKFAEILNLILLYTNGTVKKSLASSGIFDCVKTNDIQKTLPSDYEWKSLQEDLELIIIAHTHPDKYATYPINDPSVNVTNRLITHSGISKEDTILTDYIYRNKIEKKVPVIIMAVSEIGLTYTYVGGTSKIRTIQVDRHL
jgi:hypothetical protein